jgi:hypothetical protein
MGLTYPISDSLDPINLPSLDAFGFDGFETLSTEMGSFIYAVRTNFAILLANFSKHYNRDCRQYGCKMLSAHESL